MLPTKTDVLIVGAGPTGLALAISLQQAGIRYVLIERNEKPQTTSRAAVIHAHTLEVLERIGISSTLNAHGLQLANFSIRDRDKALVNLDFHPIKSKYAHLLMVPQDVTEAILRDRLTKLGGKIQFGIEGTEIRAVENHAVARLESADGSLEIQAQYVVGADGMHSIVRQSAEIEFEGESYGDSFILADVQLDWPQRRQEVSLFFSPDGLVVVAPLPDGSFRIVATVDDAPEDPQISDIQNLLDTRGPTGSVARVTDIGWRSRFRVHHRLAASYRKGPFLLMGDAAHVHSPAGGQGMNCGLVDACVLGELLGDILREKRQPSEIVQYEQLRRPAAASVLEVADRLTSMATMKSFWQRGSRNLFLRAMNMAPPVKRRLLNDLSGIARRHLSQLTKIE